MPSGEVRTMTEEDPTPRRIRKLRNVEDELREVAAADVPYSKHAKRMLAELEAWDDDQ